MNMLRLNVVTPERAFLDEECLSVTLPGLLGELQILPGHAPCLVELKTGQVAYQSKQQGFVSFMIAQGFVEVYGHQINVLCELARHKDEIDQAKEQGLVQELEGKLKTLAGKDDDEDRRLRAELEKSVASLALFD